MSGTRFLLIPQYAGGYAEPEAVLLSSPAGSLGPGPSDSRMIAIAPLDKPGPYVPPYFMPPWTGPCVPPALPGPGGHFDHVGLDDPAFPAVHLFGCVRRVLDIWEARFGRRVRWWHAARDPRLELVAGVRWDNAHSGPGFIETGFRPNRFGRPQPFALNFDVIAHEVGHAILFAEVGVPSADAVTEHYLAFHESFSDLIALISALHFRSVATRLLEQTEGNLYVENLVSRIGEISDTEEIRIASNTVRLEDVAALQLSPDGEWVDPLGLDRNAHSLAEPLTGAIFDCLVEWFQDGLAARGLIPPDLDARGWTREEVAQSLGTLRRAGRAAYARFAGGFHEALRDARDMTAACMAETIIETGPEGTAFHRVAARFLRAAARRGQQRDLPALTVHFERRGILPWRVAPPAPPGPPRPLVQRVASAHARRWARDPACPCHDPGGALFARGMMRHGFRADAV
jgi:hypothetical protein